MTLPARHAALLQPRSRGVTCSKLCVYTVLSGTVGLADGVQQLFNCCCRGRAFESRGIQADLQFKFKTIQNNAVETRAKIINDATCTDLAVAHLQMHKIETGERGGARVKGRAETCIVRRTCSSSAQPPLHACARSTPVPALKAASRRGCTACYEAVNDA